MDEPRKDLPLVALVGLGNPGKKYEKTRHNAGFQVIDQVAEKFCCAKFVESGLGAEWAKVMVGMRKVVLIRPNTFVNRSGEAVSAILRYLRIAHEQMLVVHDDLDLALGRIRLVLGGGAGGHRGVQSIIQQLGQQNFPRLRLGIGRPMYNERVEEFVLHPPYEDQKELFDEMIVRAAEAAFAALSRGIVYAMNRFNRLNCEPLH